MEASSILFDFLHIFHIPANMNITSIACHQTAYKLAKCHIYCVLEKYAIERWVILRYTLW
jgi:hypothetical protein